MMVPLPFLIPTGLLAGVAVFAVDTDAMSILLNYGVLGIVVIAAAFGWISFKPHVASLEATIVEQRKIISEFQLTSRGLAPALGRTSEALEQIHPKDAVSVENLEGLLFRLEELAGDDRGKRR